MTSTLLAPSQLYHKQLHKEAGDVKIRTITMKSKRPPKPSVINFVRLEFKPAHFNLHRLPE